MKKVLMVAFHFPPLSGTSGVQRTLRFAQQLPRFGWQPLVLTAHPRAYAETSRDLAAEIPQDMIVERASAFDCARHFSFLGRYPASLARPDRYASWRRFALRAGAAMIARHRPDVIWSTYPIASAHVIGAELAARHRLPWVADFRDPMAQDGFPADRKTWAQWRAIEANALENAARVVFTAPGAVQFYRARYPHVPVSRFEVIENGFDEASFEEARPQGPLEEGVITLLHSGVIYRAERDPRPLLRALRALAARPDCPRFRLRFRAPGEPLWLEGLIREAGLESVAHCAPPLPYRAALAEMQRADGLIVMQAGNCNAQIPAKLYEYLRARAPILGLTPRDGDTAGALRRAHAGGAAYLADPADAGAIQGALAEFIDAISSRCALRPTDQAIAQAERGERTRALADVLDQVTEHPRGAR